MFILFSDMANLDYKNQEKKQKLPREPNASKRQKLASSHKPVFLMLVCCQASLQGIEDMFKSQQSNKECLRMSLLLNTCREQKNFWRLTR